MSELEQNALNEEVVVEEAPKKKRSYRKKDANKITGKVDSDAFTSAMNNIQKDSMVSQEKISEILIDSMKQAYLEWSYPGLFRDKNCSAADELDKQKISCKIVFKDDLSKFQIFDEKVITLDDEIDDDSYQISPEDYTELTKKKAPALGSVVAIPFDVKLLDKSYVRRVNQLFQGKLKDSSRQAILSAYKDQMNGLIEGTVIKADTENSTYGISFGKASAYIRKGSNKLLPNDKFAIGERVLVYLDKVSETMNPPSLDVTRTSPKFVEKLMEREIPEVKEGIVVIKGIAREAGRRTKVFVTSLNPNIDPIGTCIGPESSRQRSISAVLRGEKIDFCKWNENKAMQIIEAMKPADVIGLTCPEDFFDPNLHFEEFENDRDYIHPIITVIVNNHTQGVAIGASGSNVRLASRLCKCKLTVSEVDDAMKKGVKAMMVPEILKAIALMNPDAVDVAATVETPTEDIADLDEEIVENEEVTPTFQEEVAPVVEAVESVEEKPSITEEVKEEKEEVKPVEVVPEKKEEPKEEIEHVEIMNKPKVSLESLEAALTQKKGPSETRSYRRKKKEEVKEESAPSLASQSAAMPIYTEEELAQFDQQEDDNLDDFNYDDEDLDQYDEYYEDEN
jgi:transcription elongation protein nusA